MTKKPFALGGRTWAALLVFGLFGQIAWVIENMYFNVFLYNTISGHGGVERRDGHRHHAGDGGAQR